MDQDDPSHQNYAQSMINLLFDATLTDDQAVVLTFNRNKQRFDHSLKDEINPFTKMDSCQAPADQKLDSPSKTKRSSQRNARVTLPNSPERPVRPHHHHHHVDQEHRQHIDQALKLNYAELEHQRNDLYTYQRREERYDVKFPVESYHEYINNFQQEQFEFEETTSYDDARCTIESKPQLQMQRLAECENNWGFFPVPHLVISIEEK